MSKISCFTTHYNGISRVLINDVAVSYPLNPANPLSNLNQESIKIYKAIWDTGATGTVITQKVVQALNLKPISMTKVFHGGGSSLRNIYAISLFLPNKVAIPILNVTDGDITGTEDLLIGMDVISMGDFAVSNYNNKTTFSFRMPSQEEIDFIKLSQPSKRKPCPCGSGKLYKNCCGKKKK